MSEPKFNKGDTVVYNGEKIKVEDVITNITCRIKNKSNDMYVSEEFLEEYREDLSEVPFQHIIEELERRGAKRVDIQFESPRWHPR